MEDIDQLGVFWLEGHDDNQLSGRLRYTPRAGVSLEVVGTFDHIGHDDRDIPKVHGWTGSTKITLSDCYFGGTKQPSQGVVSYTIKANSVFLGHHVPSADHMFHTARLQLAHLNEWIWRPGCGRSRNSPAETF